jgi:phosphoribosylaminoimidazole-succinocarboxamide synthase
MSQALTTTDLQGALPLIARGKVRDLYEIDDKTLLFVASDRISAYDVIMENVQPPLQLNCSCNSLAMRYNWSIC